MGVYVRGDNLGNSGFQMFVDIEIRKYESKSMFNLNLFARTFSNVYNAKLGKESLWELVLKSKIFGQKSTYLKKIIAFCD